MEKRITAESLLSVFGDKRITGFKSIILLVITLPLFLDLLFCLAKEWSDFFKRLLTLKEIMLIVFVTVGGYFVQIELHHIEESYIIKYLKETKNYETSEEKIKIIDDTNKYIRKHSIICIRAFKLVFIFGGCIPLVQIIIQLTKMYLTGCKLEKMAFVFHLYIPEQYNTPVVYLSMQLAAFIVYGLSIYIQGINYKVFLIGLKCINTEISLLIESLKELENFDTSEMETLPESKEINSTGSFVEKRSLKDYLRSVVVHHQSILKSLKLVNKRARLYIFLFINMYSIQLCLYIIFILKLKEIAQKMKYIFTYLLVLFIQLQWAFYAQDIQDNGDKLRLTLYRSSWLDKPQWLKKSLVLMMIQANQSLELRPYGLYALNRSFMADILKATYTYVNVVIELLNRK